MTAETAYNVIMALSMEERERLFKMLDKPHKTSPNRKNKRVQIREELIFKLGLSKGDQ